MPGFRFVLFLFIAHVPAWGVETVDFAQDIRPLLSDRCYKCHGPGDQKGDLRLDRREDALPVIGTHPDNSELLARITSHDPDEKMPPKEGGTQSLTAEEIETFRHWITQGAPYTQHWAYLPPAKEEIPAEIHPVDHFVRAALKERGLQPSPPTDPATLLRRLSLDLTGLPPTVAEVNAFVAASADNATYPAAVERLLASPHFGEKWARHWLDLARFADSNGYQHDDLRSMWPYRDWVVDAMNADMPYDRFTTEQLAGDLLESPRQDQLVATAFLRHTPTNFSGGSKVDEIQNALLMDRVNVTGQIWLGATLECAACHDHKFDPITQRDYYEIYAFFNRAVQEVDKVDPKNFRKKFIGRKIKIPIPPHAESRRATLENKKDTLRVQRNGKGGKVKNAQAAWEEEIRRKKKSGIPLHTPPRFRTTVRIILDTPVAERTAGEILAVETYALASHSLTRELTQRILSIEDELSTLTPATVHVMKDSLNPPETHIFKRGDFRSPGETVSYGVVDAFHPRADHSPENRLGLAQWLVEKKNPLTARVAVNRWWAEIFGKGIVRTLDDFGMQSSPPTHPELLDWLAVDFMEHDWSMKHVIRTIVLSQTYRQDAATSDAAHAIDPANHFLSHSPRFRLPAELVRDNALAIAGMLDSTLGGPPIFPVQPKGLWGEIPGATVTTYPTSSGRAQFRRGLYVALRRGNLNPSLLNFDASDRSLCVANRSRTNTPIQALTMLNDPVFVEVAKHFASCIENYPGPDKERARWAFQRAVARMPEPKELAVLTSLHSTDPTWFDVAQTLLNYDECICR